MKVQIIDRLSRYVKIDTQSNPESKSTPSTEKHGIYYIYYKKNCKTLD